MYSRIQLALAEERDAKLLYELQTEAFMPLYRK